MRFHVRMGSIGLQYAKQNGIGERLRHQQVYPNHVYIAVHAPGHNYFHSIVYQYFSDQKTYYHIVHG